MRSITTLGAAGVALAAALGARHVGYASIAQSFVRAAQGRHVDTVPTERGRPLVPPALPPANGARGASGVPIAQPPAGSPGAQPAFAAYQTAAEFSPTDEEAQPDTLPTLPAGMTIDMLVTGDQIFHGKGGCAVCHGMEGEGQVKAGAAITTGLLFVDATNWGQIDSLVRVGIPDGVTRAPIAMPARGAKGNLTQDEVARVAAYVWAISQTRGEPWTGGHRWHSSFGPPLRPRTTGP